MNEGDRCAALSALMRRSLCTYDLPENEQRLAQWLVLLAYDQGELVGRVDLEQWARDLGFADGKGLRPDKCRAVLESLVQLRIVNWHRGGLDSAQSGRQGTFELLPFQGDWSRLRRVRSLGPALAAGTAELRLSSEAPLDRALAENSREKAVGGPDSAEPEGRSPGSRDWPALWRRLRETLGNPEREAELLQEINGAGAVQSPRSKVQSPGAGARSPSGPDGGAASAKNAEASDKSADEVRGGLIRRHDPPGNIGGNASADLSAEIPIASLALSTKAKLAIASAKSAEGQEPEARSQKPGGAKATPQEALAWLGSVDRRGTLRGRFGSEYERLCERDPGFVVSRLRRAFEEHEGHYRQRNPNYQLPDPVGWMGRKAADEGRMQWHGKRV